MLETYRNESLYRRPTYVHIINNESLVTRDLYGNNESIQNYIPRLLAISGALVLCQKAKFELEVLLDRDAVVLRAPTSYITL